MDDAARWQATWNALGHTPLSDEWPALIARMSEKHRAYHNLQHLRECFARLDEAADLVGHTGELGIAIWYHDAIYDSCRHDNEEKSADLAVAALQRVGIGSDSIERVRTHILATKAHAPGAMGDTAWMIDLDLAILGADPARFAEYETQVRREYRWVPAPLFRRKRREFLRSMLARATIYQTPFFRERLEASARRNLSEAVV